MGRGATNGNTPFGFILDPYLKKVDTTWALFWLGRAEPMYISMVGLSTY